MKTLDDIKSDGWQSAINQVVCANNLDVLPLIPVNSVQCVITSPPYWGLRDYKSPDQIGLEDTPEEYVNRLIEVFREVKRILKKDGIIWLNLGDAYYGSGCGHHNDQSRGKYTEGQFFSASSALNIVNKTANHNFLKPKDMCGIPFRTAFALQERLGLYLRQAIIWHKPNAMPHPVLDRPLTDYEFIFLLAKSEKYYYNANAIKEPYTKHINRWGGEELKANGKSKWDKGTGQSLYRKRNMRPDPNGRTCRAVWSFNTQPSPETQAHIAVFPEELPERCVKAGAREGDLVIDPFLGSGTTAVACEKLNRKWIGIEISKEYCTIAEKRIKDVQAQTKLVNEANQ